MKIYCITNDPFLSQELAMQLSPSEHAVELFSDGLAALENINDSLPDLVMIDTECDNIIWYFLCFVCKGNKSYIIYFIKLF